MHAVSLRRRRVEWDDEDSEQELLLSSSDGYDDGDDEDGDECVTAQGVDHDHDHDRDRGRDRDYPGHGPESGLQKGQQTVPDDIYLDAPLEDRKVIQVLCTCLRVLCCVWNVDECIVCVCVCACVRVPALNFVDIQH